MMSDLDVLKEIPGYKAILKSVLKSQIHLLMEQLSEHTGEESIILTASVHDGSLSHLGSNTGKGFLEGRDEIKSQFLGYCLKTYHKKKTHEPQKPYQRTHPSPRSPAQLPTPPAKRPRPEPISLTMATSINTYPQSNIIPADISDSNVGFGSSGAIDNSIVSVKMEQEDNQSADISQQEPSDSVTSGDKSNLPESVHLSHTQTSGANNDNDTIEDSAETEQTDISDLSTIKVEQVEDELEITGVEMAAGSLDNWGQGQSGYGESDTSFDQSADQASYNIEDKKNICDICEKVFKSSSNLNDHRRQVHKARGLQSKTNLVQHRDDTEIDTADKKLDLSMILKHESSDEEVALAPEESNAEMDDSQVANDHKCSICNKTFSNKYNLKRHVRIHSPTSVYCTKCSAVLDSNDALKEHMAVRHRNIYICEDCGSHHPTKQSLRKHRIVKHNDEHKDKKVCPYTSCGRIFAEPQKLEDHINVHLNKKPYSCGKCKKSFSSRVCRNRHMKACGVKSPAMCNVCGKLFSNPQNVYIHMQSVHDEKEFVCACGKSYRYITGLLKHKKAEKHK